MSDRNEDPWQLTKENTQKIVEICNRDDLPREEKDRLLSLVAERGKHVKTIISLRLEMDQLKKDSAKCEKIIRSLQQYQHWEAPNEVKFVLQNNDCSRIHKIREAADAGLFYSGEDGDYIRPDDLTAVLEQSRIFVVKHDWAAAFEEAVGIADEYKLPYDNCAFEFRVTGHTVVLLAKPAAYGVEVTLILEGSEGVWFSMDADGSTSHLADYLTGQMRAICIALEAEVAEHAVIRAPTALNAKRERNNKPPLRDFHIVDLSRRIRAASRSAGHETGRKVRMHFRRGHWRHLETHNVWINWMLVGDPDLGFIDKHYKI